jgi:uncharacterized membrane protein
MGHILQIIYMVFLGIIIAIFCGLGIDTFYPAPKAPEMPVVLQYQKTSPVTGQTDAEIAAQKSFDEAQKQYNDSMKPYYRNVSLMAMVLAILALVLSLTVLSHWEVIANGVLLGGIFTLAYSIIMGMSTEDTKFRFFLVAFGVLVTLVLGYIKFIRPSSEK